ncbi:MAG: hypothetical protein R3Y09_02665 [Clostridia bacterium]
MSNYTIEQFYNSDKYNIHGECFKDFWLDHQNCKPTDETHIILMLTVKHTILATLNLIRTAMVPKIKDFDHNANLVACAIKNGDCISEIETEMQSLLSCLEVKTDEHN